MPIEGKPVAYDAIAAQLATTAHGSIVIAQCSFVAGRGFVATTLESVIAPPGDASDEDTLATLVKGERFDRALEFIDSHRRAVEQNPKLLLLATTVLTRVGRAADADITLRQLVRFEPAPKLSFVDLRRAFNALPEPSEDLQRDVAALYAKQFAKHGLFPEEVPERFWPNSLVQARARAKAALKQVKGWKKSLFAAGKARAFSRAAAAQRVAELGVMVRWTEPNLRDTSLPAAARRWLVELGLPRRVGFHWSAEAPPKNRTLEPFRRGLYRIGASSGGPDDQGQILLLLDDAGAVHFADDEPTAVPVAIGSSLAVVFTRLCVMHGYLEHSERLFGAAGSDELEEIARDMLGAIERATFVDYWDPDYWLSR